MAPGVSDAGSHHSCRAPYQLENRSGQPLRYRQSGISDLPYIPLPAYSAAGFAWQNENGNGTPRVSPSFVLLCT